MKKTTALLVGSLGALPIVLATGCANQTVRDLEGVPVEDPDSARIIVNVDQYPNLVITCVDGVAFVTTTRELDGIVRVEALDKTC